jgi:hypothetical protein
VIGAKLDKDIARMGEEASLHCDTLRQSIEAKLDDAAAKQSAAAKEAREEIVGSFKMLAVASTRR